MAMRTGPGSDRGTGTPDRRRGGDAATVPAPRTGDHTLLPGLGRPSPVPRPPGVQDADGSGVRVAAPRPAAVPVYVDLHEHFGDLAEWAARHARGEVPDAVPYGLDKLARHGVAPTFRTLLQGSAAVLARKTRNRLGQADVVAVALGAARRERRCAEAVLCWDERNGIPAALVPGGPPVASGAVWLADPAKATPSMRRMARAALPRMGAVFHFCRPMGPVLERAWGLPAGSVRTLTLGVDEQFYRPQPLAAVPNVVASVGDDRLRDHELLVRALERLRRRGVPVSLELATTRQVEVPEQLGIVHRRRMEGSILGMYRRSSVVAIAAKPVPAAGSGLTVTLEAMACARPVVITANPGIEEYVEHGLTGLLVPPGDDEAFADAVASLLADPAAAQEMGRAGRRAVEQRFTTDHLAADIAALLRSIR
jgi:glycosyltransferase involved in cell wall biosynthesis